MKLIYMAIVALSFLIPLPYQEEALPDIPPQKGDVSKNIHIIFDKSYSMTTDDFKIAYKEIEEIVTTGTDEFNIAVTAFGNTHERMIVKDDSCKIGANWMSMPSLENSQKIMKWIKGVKVGNSTFMYSAIADVLRDNKKDVTVIIISDCSIDDIVSCVRLIEKARQTKEHNKFNVGFVDTDYLVPKYLHESVKKLGGFYICLDRRGD